MAVFNKIAVYSGNDLENIDFSALGNVFEVDAVRVTSGVEFASPDDKLTLADIRTLLGGSALFTTSSKSDASALHSHDTDYHTKAALAASTAASGATLISVEDKAYAGVPGFTTADQPSYSLQEFLDGVVAAIGLPNVKFDESDFVIFKNGAPTNELTVRLTALTSSRQIIMPDQDVDLTDLNTALQRDGSVQVTGHMDFNNNRINNLADGLLDGDAMNRGQILTLVAATAAAITLKDPVTIRSTAALPAATYNNGTAGVGATLTATSNGAFPTIDGVTLTSADSNPSILVMDQADPIENGIYVLSQTGDGANPWILTRRADFDGSPASETKLGSYVGVLRGTQWERHFFMVTGTDANANDSIDVGVEGMIFEVFRFPDEITVDGTFLDRTGNLVSFDPSFITGDALINLAGVLTIQDDAITTAKILNGAVTTDKIGSLEVKTANIDNLSVTDAKLASDSVSTAKIIDDNVTAAKIAPDVAGLGISQHTDGSLDAGTLIFSNATGSAIPAGTFVYISADDQITPAQADDPATSMVIGVTAEAIADSTSGRVWKNGEIVPGILTAATAGTEFYLSTSTAGETQTADVTTVGHSVVFLGYAVNATDLLLNIQRPIEIA